MSTSPPEALAWRTYFYVGGKYVDDGTGANTDVMVGQMYVEHLVCPSRTKQKYPLVFVTGAGQTGTNWLNTPDGRQGWASWFLELGYEVYIVDHPQRGRSPTQPNDKSIASMSAQYIEKYFTATKDFKLWPHAALHTQWPGTGRKGDTIFDNFYASQVPFQRDYTIAEANARRSLTCLLDLIGPSILITHSNAGSHGWATADSRPNLVKAIIALEPSGPPFETRVPKAYPSRPHGITYTPLTYNLPVIDPHADLPKQTYTFSPAEIHGVAQDPVSYKIQAEPARKLVNLSAIPILVITSGSSYHVQYDHATVAYLRQAGVRDVEHLELEKEGMCGNGHFFFMEENNLKIAERVEKWISGVAIQASS